jgi:hypothetical protein
MADANEFWQANRDVSPMTSIIELSEGLNNLPIRIRQIGFDIETFSSLGFLKESEDPIVNTTLALSPTGNVRGVFS